MERTSTDPDELQREDWNSLLNNYDKHDVGEAYFTGRMHQIGLHTEHWGIDMRHDDGNLIKDDKMDLRLWEPLNGQDSPGTWPSDVADIEGVDTPDTAERWHRYDTDSGKSYTHTTPDRPSEEWLLRGVVDVKTKANQDWMCAFNIRHFAHYAHWADTYDVPVFVYFTMVDMDDERVGEQNVLVPVSTDWNYEVAQDHFDTSDPVTLDWPTLKDVTSDATIADRVSRAPDGNPVVWTDEDEWRNFDYLVEKVL
jgi:hypothetical protein